jgi:hypothetical protein
MKKYRVKKEAVPFINAKHLHKVCELEIWDKIGLDMNALEEVEPAYISYGKKIDANSSTLCGWSEDGGRFEFTINFPNMKHKEYDKFCKGKTTRALMDIVQTCVNNYYEHFLNEEPND